MLNELNPILDSLGNEPIEVLGFCSEHDMEIALRPLMLPRIEETYLDIN